MASTALPLLNLRNILYVANARQLLIQEESYVLARWFSNQRSKIDSENAHPRNSDDDKPKSVPVHVAYEFLKSGYHYLDVRTLDEFKAGHVPKAINIIYQFRSESGMSKNPEFLEQVLARFRKDDEILVGCRSGKRSLMAATELKSAGFTHAINVAGGYISWKDEGLPTTE